MTALALEWRTEFIGADGAVVHVSSVYAQEEQGSHYLLLPIALSSGGIDSRATQPAHISTPTSSIPHMPTPTATSMLRIGPPSTVYGDCIVVRETHRNNDALITDRIRVEYNSASHTFRRFYDVKSADGTDGADGIIDRRWAANYHDEWMLLDTSSYRGESSDFLLSRTEYIYDESHRLVLRSTDGDGDGRSDTIDTYTYDRAGMLIQFENGAHRIDYSYDQSGRMIRQYEDIGNDGSPDFGIHYIWGGGLIVRVDYVDGNGQTEFSGNRLYDAARRLVLAETLSGDWVYNYADNGWVSSVGLFKGEKWESTIEYEYDDSGRLTIERFRDHVGDGYYRTFENVCPSE